MSGSGGGAAGTPIFLGPTERPKDLFGAISQLEIIYEAEKSGAELPEKFATLKDRIDYFNLGMRSIFGGAFISIVLAPISSAVIENNMPIFGSFNPNLIQKALAYILSFGYSIAYMMLFLYAAKLRRTTISNIISSALIFGMTIGAVLKLFIAVFTYGLLYYMVLTPENLSKFFTILVKLNISKGIYDLIYFVTVSIKNSLIPAIFIFSYTTIALILIPWVTVFYKKIKNRKKEF